MLFYALKKWNTLDKLSTAREKALLCLFLNTHFLNGKTRTN